jgi:hypothetical protein
VPGLILSRFGLELPHTTILGRGIIRRVRFGRGVAGLEITSISQKDRATLATFVEEVGRTSIVPAVENDLPKLATVLENTGAIDPARPPPPALVKAYCRLRSRALRGGSTVDAPLPSVTYIEDDDVTDKTSVSSIRASRPPGTIPCIVIIGGARNAGKIVRVKDGMTIGRSLNNDIVLDEPGVSRMHARLRHARDGSILVEDLGSTHGLGHDGLRMASVPLQDGGRVQIGDAAITLIRMDDPDPTSIRRLDPYPGYGRGLKANANDLVLLAAGSGTEIEGTAEVIRESGTTWLLHHVGIMPTSRLAVQELVAEAIEVAVTRPKFEYVRSLLRVEQDDALETLVRMQADPRSLAWREWLEIIEAPPSAPAGRFGIRPMASDDGVALDAILRASLEPLELAAATIARKTDPPDALVLVVATGAEILASAHCKRGVAGVELAGPAWTAKVFGRDPSPLVHDAIGLLLHYILTSDVLRDGVRALVSPALRPELAERGLVSGASWVEAVATQAAASQLTNVWAVLM